MTEAIRAFVKKILENPLGFEWSKQGLGMLRLYLSDTYRLHVWDPWLRVPGVSDIHTHPWDLTSWVLSGYLRNQRFVVENYGIAGSMLCKRSKILCGPNSGLQEEVDLCSLSLRPTEHYTVGSEYYQKSNEIHLSLPVDGTVTLTKRVRAAEDITYVYWPAGTEWVSAEPSKATKGEVLHATKLALSKWV